MVARVGRIDRDNRKMTEILAPLAESLAGAAVRFLQRRFGEDVRNAIFVDRD